MTGDSQAIQNFLKSHCDCHPLVTGILAGLINDYLPNRGDFDAWAADPAGGGALDLANLDLIQKRNHILNAALAALSEESRQFLSILALISEAVDYATLAALNAGLSQHELTITVRDLQHRGLLQYDAQSKRYDLHPVVRAIAAGRLQPGETESYGKRVVDHFSSQAHRPYAETETLEDVRAGLHVVRILLKMGHYLQAADAYLGALSYALLSNLEANTEALSLLRAFFPQGWAKLPPALDEKDGSILANDAAVALRNTGQHEQALAVYGTALAANLSRADWVEVRTVLSNLSNLFMAQNRLAQEDHCQRLGLDVAILTGNDGQIFIARLFRFSLLTQIGEWAKAQALWDLLDPMGRNWPRHLYRPGNVEYHHALFRFWQGELEEKHLVQAEELAKQGKNRAIIRALHRLRGEWCLERSDWGLAAESLGEAVSMARGVGDTDPQAETQLALARFHLGQLVDSQHEAEQLASAQWVSPRALAEIWPATGNRDRAKPQALAAYKFAWPDGEPYVSRYELNKARALLEQVGAEIPNLPPYDPAKAEKLPWEDELVAAIEKLRVEKQANPTTP